VRYSYWILASLGLALMAVPFRIARGAGAFLLSFSLVFYIGLPLYPQFVSLMLSSTDTEASFPFIYGRVFNEYNKTVYQGYITLRSNNEDFGPIPLYSGYYAIISFSKKLRYNSTISLLYDVSGHLFYTNITNKSISSLCKQMNSLPRIVCRVDVMVYGLILYDKGRALHIYPRVTDINIDILNDTLIVIKVINNNRTELYISAVNAYEVVKLCIDNECMQDLHEYEQYHWTWYNIEGRTYSFTLEPGNHTIAVYTQRYGNMITEPTELFPLSSSFISGEESLGFFDSIAKFIYIEIASAIIYLMMLLSITLGLSKILGGISRLRMIV